MIISVFVIKSVFSEKKSIYLREIPAFNANSDDPDQTPRSAASDQGLHCLPITFYGTQCVNWLNSGMLFDFLRNVLTFNLLYSNISRIISCVVMSIFLLQCIF